MTRIEDRLAGYVDRLDADSTPITPDEVLTRRPAIRRRRGPALVAAGVAVIVLVAGVIISQGDDGTQVVSGPADRPVQEPPPDALAPASDDVSLWLSAREVPPGDTEIIAVLLNHTGVDATFGVEASVERWDGTAWVPHRRLAMCLDHWHCTSELVDLGDPNFGIDDIGLSAGPSSPGPPERFSTAGLDEGWYRLSQTTNGHVASGVLHVVEGAEPAVPLWPIDAPAISIAPSVMTPDGGPILLSPLVPPTNGNLSSEDVERAVEGLAEVARIERWDGRGWAAAGEVPLVDDESAGLFARSAEVPPLDVGAYRLLRTGQNEAHVGSFWVVDTADLDGGDLDARASSAGTDGDAAQQTIRLAEAGVAVTFDLPAQLRPLPRQEVTPGPGLLHLEQWLDTEDNRVVGMSIQSDPGDDAPLFQMLAIQQFRSPLGVWTVHELGGDGMTTAMAMLRHEGLVYQITGGVPHAPEVAMQIAMSLEVAPLPSG